MSSKGEFLGDADMCPQQFGIYMVLPSTRDWLVQLWWMEESENSGSASFTPTEQHDGDTWSSCLSGNRPEQSFQYTLSYGAAWPVEIGYGYRRQSRKLSKFKELHCTEAWEQVPHVSQKNAPWTEGVLSQDKMTMTPIKEKGICLFLHFFTTHPKTGRNGREKAVSQTWPKCYRRTLNRTLIITSKWNLGRLPLKSAESHRVMDSA